MAIVLNTIVSSNTNNKIHHINFNQFNKSYSKKQNALKCKNPNIGIKSFWTVPCEPGS